MDGPLGVACGLGCGGRDGTHPEELEAFEPLPWDYGYEFHFAEEGDFGGGEAGWEGECHDCWLDCGGGLEVSGSMDGFRQTR